MSGKLRTQQSNDRLSRVLANKLKVCVPEKLQATVFHFLSTSDPSAVRISLVLEMFVDNESVFTAMIPQLVREAELYDKKTSPSSSSWSSKNDDSNSNNYATLKDVLEKLVLHIPENSNHYLTKVICLLLYDSAAPTILQVLKAVADDESEFKITLQFLIHDADEWTRDESKRQFFKDMWENYLYRDDQHLPITHLIEQILSQKVNLTVGTVAFMESVAALPPELQRQMLAWTGLSGQLTAGVGAALVPVVLVAGCIAVEAFENIVKWWQGKISGQRCVKSIMDSTMKVAAGVGGAVGGAALGSMIMPGMGTFAGAMIGGLVSSTVAASVSDWLTCRLFSLPKEAALENAYRFMGLPPVNATIREINWRYRLLALQHHPDKGGDANEWNKLQTCFAIIKASKGQHH